MSKQFHRLIKKIYWNCFDMNLLVRWMIVLPEVVFDFVFCIKDFTFEGVVPEQTFLPIVGEGGFTDREAVRKFGVGDKSYAVKQRPGFLSEFIGYGIDITEYSEDLFPLLFRLQGYILSHISHNCHSEICQSHRLDSKLCPQSEHIRFCRRHAASPLSVASDEEYLVWNGCQSIPDDYCMKADIMPLPALGDIL